MAQHSIPSLDEVAGNNPAVDPDRVRELTGAVDELRRLGLWEPSRYSLGQAISPPGNTASHYSPGQGLRQKG